VYTDDIISCRLILTNGSIVFSSITDSGASPDTGSYRCIAEKIGSGGKVHRIATPEVFLRSACKTFCNYSPSFYTLLNSAGYSLPPHRLESCHGRQVAVFLCTHLQSPVTGFSELSIDSVLTQSVQ